MNPGQAAVTERRIGLEWSTLRIQLWLEAALMTAYWNKKLGWR